MDYFKMEMALLNENNFVTDLLVTMEEKTGIQRKYTASDCRIIGALNLLFGYGVPLIPNLIGFVYPAYFSIKAIESKEKDDYTHWLTYWVVYRLFSVTSDIFLSCFPLYYAVECLFLVWCMAPVTWNGSDILYFRVVRPVFLRHQATLDSVVNNLSDKAKNMDDTVTKVLTTLPICPVPRSN
uniref:Receptor expression-enhancing protein n=1 Tax=Hucho hucho TaxID=62062 RepID=A0A4W5P408_9TELE